MKFIRTGIDPLDSILMGGFPVGSSTLLYGPSESGKTFISVNAACKLALLGYRTLYIDADKKFDPKLIEQLYPTKCEKIFDKIIIVRPKDFLSLSHILLYLPEFIEDDIKLIVLDTVSTLYRLNRNENKHFYFFEFAEKQIPALISLGVLYEAAVVLASQVEGFNGDIKPVAWNALEPYVKVVLRLERLSLDSRVRVATLEKYFDIKLNAKVFFEMEVNPWVY
ncbi:MAG: ATPase domain-containing protein [Candidatus Baldrarchaeia archaeon]